MSGVPYSYEGLDPKYMELAKKDLKEDPKKVHAHIASLRNWLSQSKHIKNCPDDDVFLLRFLRVAKFDHENAQARLENFCTVRGSEQRGFPQLFRFPKLDDPYIKKFLRMGFILPCGTNTKGEIVIVTSMKDWNPSEISYTDLVPYMWMASECLLNDQRCQIAGITGVFDMDGLQKKHIDSMMANQTVLKTNMRVWQEGCAIRNRDFFYYKEPLIFDMFFGIMRFWMKEKLLKRIHRVKNDLQKIHDKMPGAKDVLPKEYGGNNGTIDELKDKWEKQFFDFFSKPNPCANIVVDESLRPKDSLRFLKEYADLPDDLAGTKGTYTKIEAD